MYGRHRNIISIALNFPWIKIPFVQSLIIASEITDSFFAYTATYLHVATWTK